jgi:hypothetical protein
LVASLPVSAKEGSASFGLLIAYVLPGFTALQGFPFLAGTASPWGVRAGPSTLPSFLSGTVEAMAAGLTVSTVRWFLIDRLHHRTGLTPPQWDFALLEKSVAALEFLTQNHYSYYLFYSNMVVALVYAYATHCDSLGWRGLVYLALAVLFFLASRDALRRFYDRAGSLLGSRSEGAGGPR